MADPERAVGSTRIVQTSTAADAITGWTFSADAVHAARPDPDALFPVALRIESGRADTLEDRIAAFTEKVNRGREKKLRQPKLRVAALNRRGRGNKAPTEPGEDVFSVLSDAALLELLAVRGAENDTDHPANDIFISGHGAALPADAVGPETALPAPLVPNLPPKPGLVITAVIDTGLPFLNAAFRDGPASTRVRYAWVQDGPVRPEPDQHVHHGREFTKQQIDGLLAAGGAGQPVTDEAALYRDEGLADFTRKGRHALGYASTHGAFVATAAAGYPVEAAQTDQAIIFVQLPDGVVADTSGASAEPYFIAAVDYILDRADRVAEAENCGRLPLVINFSFGGTGGPLDGTSPIEQYMDAVVKTRNQGMPGKTAMVLPAGNSYLSRCHAVCRQGEAFGGTDGTEVLTWQIQPDDHTASFVEIWTPKRQQPDQKVLEVGLSRPYDTAAPVLLPETEGSAIDILEGGEVVGRVAYEWVGPPTSRGKFTVIVQATGSPAVQTALAPSGPWKITLRDAGLTPGGQVDAWILRDDELPRFDTDARQSRFTDVAYEMWTDAGYPEEEDQAGCPVHRAGLQNVLATGQEPIVVGGYRDRSGRAAIYSAGGPVGSPHRDGPDAMAVSDDSVVHWGVLSGLVLSGGRAPANGTSMSAPALARKLAQILAAGGAAAKADRQLVKQMAQASEASDFANRVGQPPVLRSGEGRIQLEPQSARRYQP